MQWWHHGGLVGAGCGKFMNWPHVPKFGKKAEEEI
jgi:hypothetical protein